MKLRRGKLGGLRPNGKQPLGYVSSTAASIRSVSSAATSRHAGPQSGGQGRWTSHGLGSSIIVESFGAPRAVCSDTSLASGG